MAGWNSDLENTKLLYKSSGIMIHSNIVKVLHIFHTIFLTNCWHLSISNSFPKREVIQHKKCLSAARNYKVLKTIPFCCSFRSFCWFLIPYRIRSSQFFAVEKSTTFLTLCCGVCEIQTLKDMLECAEQFFNFSFPKTLFCNEILSPTKMPMK